MKSNSPRIERLLAKFSKTTNWWQRFIGMVSVDGFYRLRAEMSPLDLAAFDLRVRRLDIYTNSINKQWSRLRPADLTRFERTSQATSYLGFASFHYSGFVREAAVDQLALERDGSELPFLLIRLNDWVEPVRQKAAKAVRLRLVPAYAKQFLANIGLVLRVEHLGRADRQIKHEVFQLLMRPECQAVLQVGMKSDDRLVRKLSFQLAVESGRGDRFGIMLLAMKDSECGIRAWAARSLLPDLKAAEVLAVMDVVLCDSFMPVRRDALWTVATRHPDLAAEPVRRAMLDRHVSMREVARQHALLGGVNDARSFYLNAVECGDEAQRFIAIRGIGETGNASDATMLMKHLASPVTKIRRAAVYAVGRLDAVGHLETLLQLLTEAEAGVSREALKGLLPIARCISAERLEQMLGSQGCFQVRLSALRLIMRIDKWQRLPALLKTCADADPVLVQITKRAVRDWFSNYNRSFAEPTRSDLEKIQAAMVVAGFALTRDQTRELDACLRPYFK